METIDEAGIEDIEGMIALLEVLFRQEADFQSERARQERALRMILGSPAIGKIFVAREDKRVIGMISLLFTVSTAEGGWVCLLEDMVVSAEKRGMGTGSRLLQHALAFAQAHGYTRVTLLTDSVNEGAIRFYKEHGFKPSAMRVLRWTCEQ